MIRVCGWCGIWMGVKPPVDDSTVTHGMCRRCGEREYQARLQVLSLERGRLPTLIVVARHQPEVYGALRAIFDGVVNVEVVLDRRTGERRRDAQPVGGNRRGYVRRRRLYPSQSALWALGVLVVQRVPFIGLAPCAIQAPGGPVSTRAHGGGVIAAQTVSVPLRTVEELSG